MFYMKKKLSDLLSITLVICLQDQELALAPHLGTINHEVWGKFHYLYISKSIYVRQGLAT
jgi:hypothetical protein